MNHIKLYEEFNFESDQKEVEELFSYIKRTFDNDKLGTGYKGFRDDIRGYYYKIDDEHSLGIYEDMTLFIKNISNMKKTEFSCSYDIKKEIYNFFKENFK